MTYHRIVGHRRIAANKADCSHITKPPKYKIGCRFWHSDNLCIHNKENKEYM